MVPPGPVATRRITPRVTSPMGEWLDGEGWWREPSTISRCRLNWAGDQLSATGPMLAVGVRAEAFGSEHVAALYPGNVRGLAHKSPAKACFMPWRLRSPLPTLRQEVCTFWRSWFLRSENMRASLR